MFNPASSSIIHDVTSVENSQSKVSDPVSIKNIEDKKVQIFVLETYLKPRTFFCPILNKHYIDTRSIHTIYASLNISWKDLKQHVSEKSKLPFESFWIMFGGKMYNEDSEGTLSSHGVKKEDTLHLNLYVRYARAWLDAWNENEKSKKKPLITPSELID